MDPTAVGVWATFVGLVISTIVQTRRNGKARHTTGATAPEHWDARFSAIDGEHRILGERMQQQHETLRDMSARLTDVHVCTKMIRDRLNRAAGEPPS